MKNFMIILYIALISSCQPSFAQFNGMRDKVSIGAESVVLQRNCREVVCEDVSSVGIAASLKTGSAEYVASFTNAGSASLSAAFARDLAKDARFSAGIGVQQSDLVFDYYAPNVVSNTVISSQGGFFCTGQCTFNGPDYNRFATDWKREETSLTEAFGLIRFAYKYYYLEYNISSTQRVPYNKTVATNPAQAFSEVAPAQLTEKKFSTSFKAIKLGVRYTF